MATSKPFTAYPLPAPLRSSLFKNPTDGVVPPIDDLEALHAELKNLKARTMEKARRTGEDMKVLEEGMRRMKERAKKGKEREGKEKIKRERDFSATPLPEFADDGKPLALSLSSSVASGSSKPRLSSLPLNSGAPSSARSSVDPRGEEKDKKKKKKRKRELLEESDVEMDASPRVHKGTPPVAHIAHSIASSSSVSVPPKASKSISSSSHGKNSSLSHTGIDFAVPQPLLILPPRPPIQPPPIPAPSHPTLVSEDFSKIPKAPTAQVAITTFYSSVEPYLRPIKEEDIGFLEWGGDEIEPYVMPKLGKHYLEVWEEQDRLGLPPSMNTTTTIAGSSAVPNPSAVAPNPSFDPSTLAEPDTQSELLGHGPLTERLIAALLPMPDSHLTWKGVKAAEDAMEGRPGGSGAAASRREKLTVADLEKRIGDTMRSYGLLPIGAQQVDYDNKIDDPIATALRINQAELRRVSTTNRLRRERYAAVAKDRLAYGEYMENIVNLYNKLQRVQKAQKEAPKLGRKKKLKTEDGVVNGLNGSGSFSASASANGDAVPLPPPPIPPCPAALGLGPDEDNQLVVSDALKHLVQTRKAWVKVGDMVLDDKEGPLEPMDIDMEEPDSDDSDSEGLLRPNVNWRGEVSERPRRGRILGFPKESIFKGLEEEVEEIMREWEQQAGLQEQAKASTSTTANSNSNSGTTTASAQPAPTASSSSGSGLKIHLNGHVQATYGKGKGKARDDQMDVG
ncbi:hypothetical protein BT96DRAFT_919494 [Gymnopus androsaceus JB14]|uniref:Transcriptional regulator Ngg1 n=1 Tax=Gymnopus androsaceus JB14 TaxID=1447944 RepID=A0A6A4HRX7_9AGAR|nr:hypothetical protein BT96DRAFT_919494 [Gymnopus androsaceus JB14]